MLALQLPLIFWTVIVFLGLLFVCYKVLLPPILSAVDKREEVIKASVEKAEKIKTEAEGLLLEYKKKVEGAELLSRKLLERAKEEAGQIAKEELAKAHVEARKIVENTKFEIDAIKVKAAQELKERGGEVIILATQKLLGREISKADDLKIIEGSLDEV